MKKVLTEEEKKAILDKIEDIKELVLSLNVEEEGKANSNEE